MKFQNKVLFPNRNESYGILAKGNIIVDILHPYYWENTWHSGMTPEQVAAMYENDIIIPSVNLYGSENCWIGETFAFPAWQGFNEATQVRFLTAMINVCLRHGVGLQVWAYFGRMALQDEALVASNYLD